jgi:cysteine synthase
VEEVGSKDAFSLSLQLCREGLICGPSSGFNLQGKQVHAQGNTGLTGQGLLNYLAKQKAAGTLEKLAGADGLLRCVTVCCDLPYQYIDEYFDKVNSNEFRPIKNQVS